MNAGVFLSVLWLARVGAAAWALVLALWAALVVWIYPSIRGAFPAEEYLKVIPEEFLGVIGVSGGEGMALLFDEMGFTFVGYVNTEYIAWMPLLMGIYAVVYCGGLVAQEVERGTMDLLLSQPLSRTTFLLSKLAGFAVLCLGIAAVSYATLMVGALITGAEADWWNLAKVHLVALLLAMAIAGYSTLASTAFLDPRRALAVAGLATALTYFANIVGAAVAGLGWLKWLSLFYYFESLELAALGRVNWTGVWVYLGVALATVAISLAVFRRKDLVR